MDRLHQALRGNTAHPDGRGRGAGVNVFGASAATGLPATPLGTRVIAPELLWHWAQHAGGLDAALAQWLPANHSP